MNFNLSEGYHKHADEGTCAMEAVSILAGEPFSDNPTCVCHVISTFVRELNDLLPDDETRNRLLLPLLPRLIGTRDSSKELARSYLAADYVVRVFAARALQAAGVSDTLSRLPEIVDRETAIDASYAIPSSHVVAYRASVAFAAAPAADAASNASNAAYTVSAAETATNAVIYGDYIIDVATWAARAAHTAVCAVRAVANGVGVDAMYAKTVELIEKMIEI